MEQFKKMKRDKRTKRPDRKRGLAHRQRRIFGSQRAFEIDAEAQIEHSVASAMVKDSEA